MYTLDRKIDPNVLRELIDESNAKYSANSRSFILTCPDPACGKEKLHIERSSGRWICFGGAHGSDPKSAPFEILAPAIGLSYRDVVRRLYGYGALPASQHVQVRVRDFWGSSIAEDEDIVKTDDRVVVQYPDDYVPLTEAPDGLGYMASRGVPEEVCAQYGLMWAPWSKRIVFPVSEGGKLFGWQARASHLTPKEFTDKATGKVRPSPKVITMKGTPTAKTLMFQDRMTESPHVVLCEGPIDAIKAHSVGGNVAAMGKAIKEGQIDIIRKSKVKKVYLALDPDAGPETTRLARIFGQYELYLLHPPEGVKDLGDCTFEQVYQQFLHAPRIFPGQVFRAL